VDAATHSLLQDQRLVTKVYFPRILIPVAAALPGLLDVAIGLVLLGAALLVTGQLPGARVVVVPLLVVSLLVVTTGIGLLGASAAVRYRDARHVVAMLVQLLFFATPLAYPSTVVPERWRPLYFLNPLAGIVESLRWGLTAAPAPGWAALASVVGGLLVVLFGVLAYLWGERAFADVI
jgi:lipopolysaccharide transport system permease protein